MHPHHPEQPLFLLQCALHPSSRLDLQCRRRNGGKQAIAVDLCVSPRRVSYRHTSSVCVPSAGLLTRMIHCAIAGGWNKIPVKSSPPPRHASKEPSISWRKKAIPETMSKVGRPTAFFRASSGRQPSFRVLSHCSLHTELAPSNRYHQPTRDHHRVGQNHRKASSQRRGLVGHPNNRNCGQPHRQDKHEKPNSFPGAVPVPVPAACILSDCLPRRMAACSSSPYRMESRICAAFPCRRTLAGSNSAGCWTTFRWCRRQQKTVRGFAFPSSCVPASAGLRIGWS